MSQPDARSTPHRSRLTTAFTAATREPVSEFLLIPFGQVTVDSPLSGDGFVFTADHARAATRWFESLGRTLAIDYEHQSLDRFNTRDDGLSPAAGWIGGLDVRDDGLWATKVAWTPRAAELLRNAEYRYFSPVIYWADEDHNTLVALGPVALTNDPAMRGVQPLAARRTPADGSDELAVARAEILTLRAQLTRLQADTFIERGLRTGKIVPATVDDWRTEFAASPQRAEQRLAAAPVILPPGRVIAVDAFGRPQPLPGSDNDARTIDPRLHAWGPEADDLTAYDRAVAAGRVRAPTIDR